MPTIFPGAIWQPIETRYLPNRPLAEHNRVNAHVAVSESASIYPVFNAPGRTSSHLYVRRDGVAVQYVDLDHRAEADLEGNDATWSVETQGGVNDPQGEPWTDAQVETLAQFYAFIVKTYGVPLKVATDSKIGSSSHGLSWHRLGIDGNFPALPSILAGRIQRGGGMHYSTSRGKLCPGNAKIEQVPLVFERASALLGGAIPAPTPAPTPAPIPVYPVIHVPKRLKVDGSWGPLTSAVFQRLLGVNADGIFGPISTKALQRFLGVKADGVFGPITKRAMQRWLGVKQDGIVGPITIKALQRKLNIGKLR